MLKKNIIRGDITTALKGVILHGCNAQGKMGKGVAEAIRKKWSEVFDAYIETYHKQGNKLFLGQCIPVQVEDGLIVVNGITQRYYGKDGARYVNYEAVHDVFKQTIEFCSTSNLDLHYPMIGSGYGGANWDKVSDIITSLMFEYPEVSYNLWIYE